MKRLIAGPRAVSEALHAAPKQLQVIYAVDARRDPIRSLLQAARERRVACEEVSRQALDTLSRGLRHQGVLAIGGDYPYRSLDEILSEASQAPLLVALDQITDPHNFGAILRSAVAFGADGVLTLKHRAAPISAATVRASAGATEQARIARITNLARTLVELQKRGLQTVGLTAEAERTLEDLPYPIAGRVLVIGSEGSGLRRLVAERCEVHARLPLHGPMASLNASVAAGIALYLSARSRDASSDTSVR